jgi:hypothetical protein
MKKLAIFLTFCLLTGGVAYFVTLGDEDIAQMTIARLSGNVEVLRDGETIEVKDGTALEPGDFISTDSEGLAKLRVAGERRAWLDYSSRVAVVDDTTLESRSGNMRAAAGTKDELEVIFDGISAVAKGANFRIDQGFGSARAGSYAGELELTQPGQPRLLIDPLFQASVAAGQLPVSVKPYQFSAEDDWDADFLKDELALDLTLTQLGDGLASQLGRSRPKLGYFKSLAGKNVSFMRGDMRRPTKDLLIGFAVADNVKGASLASSFALAFDYRDAGGRWGIIASILDASPKALLADLGSIITASGVVAGGGDEAEPQFTLAAAAEAGGAPAPAGTSGTSGTSVTDDGNTTTGDDKPTGGEGPTKEPKEPKEPANDCSSGPECDLQEIGDKLPNPNPSPSPTDEPPITKGVIDSLP